MILRYGVLVVALMIFVGEMGVPTGIPVEIALMIAGAYAIHSTPGLITGVILVTAADFFGTLTLYVVARTGGVRLLNRFLNRHLEEGRAFIGRWRARLGGHDVLVVFVGRLLPLLRMYVTIGAGLLGFPLRDFIIGALPASFFWGGLPLLLGYFLHVHVQRIAREYTRATHVVLIVTPLIGVVFTVFLWVRHGGSLRAKLLRGRSAVGLAVAVIAIAFLARMALIVNRAAEQGRVAFPVPFLVLWLMLLGGLAAALLAVALLDLRLVLRRRERHLPVPPIATAEIVATLAWLTLVLTAGAIMIGIQLRFPAL